VSSSGRCFTGSQRFGRLWAACSSGSALSVLAGQSMHMFSMAMSACRGARIVATPSAVCVWTSSARGLNNGLGTA
jgi:hypothetical protein